MHLPSAIMHLFPDANPLLDFEVRDDGPAPILREGVEEKGRVRYEIKQPEEGEEPVEGVHFRYGIDYNLLTEGQDYDIVDKGPYISVWNLEAQQPTEAELQAAWEAYQQAEANKPPKLTDVEQLQLALTDSYEQTLAAQQDATNTQLALADLYELTLSLQAEVTALKGGAN